MIHDSLTRRQVLVRGIGAAIVSAVAGCLRGSRTAEHSTVTMTDDLRFEPKTIRVPVETTIVWENTSEANHTVTAVQRTIPDDAAYFASGGFASEDSARNDGNDGLVEPGETYSHTFRRPGTYAYVCLPHEQSGMTGTITVTAEND